MKQNPTKIIKTRIRRDGLAAKVGLSNIATISYKRNKVKLIRYQTKLSRLKMKPVKEAKNIKVKANPIRLSTQALSTRSQMSR